VTRPLRILFYKRDIAWPFRSGHDVHTFHMMQALAAVGHRVALVTVQPLPSAVRESLTLELHTVAPNNASDDKPFGLPMLQERFRRFWGISSTHLETVQQLTAGFAADAVVTPGMEALPVLAAIHGPLRIWYAADELALHHFSQVRLAKPSSWGEAREGIFKGFYERTFRTVIDRVWAVSDVDARAFRHLIGIRGVDIIPNGVDATRYQPAATAEVPFTAAFWGRLDFGPNIQGLQWFFAQVWPLVIARHPHAEFTIIGFHPGNEVRELATLPGVTLCADVPDIQDLVHSRAIAVLPFRSGTGIKNKLLEAAAMGKAIVCTRTALSGLSAPPFAGLEEPLAWVDELSRLWGNDEERLRRGREARQWVTSHHTWAAAAQKAEAAIAEGLALRR
jgi:glycosyltransferase involved in cell wall biosynthesis